MFGLGLFRRRLQLPKLARSLFAGRPCQPYSEQGHSNRGGDGPSRHDETEPCCRNCQAPVRELLCQTSAAVGPEKTASRLTVATNQLPSPNPAQNDVVIGFAIDYPFDNPVRGIRVWRSVYNNNGLNGIRTA